MTRRLFPPQPGSDALGASQDSDLECLNCDGPIPPTLRPGTLFCSEICRQRADTVRYARRVYRDGRIGDPLVREALRTKMAFAVTDGGYARALRELDSGTRQAVVQRDGGKCVLCGQPGTEIDHIVDSSPDLSNLQLLCRDCHATKTAQNFRPIEVGSPPDVMWKELMARINAGLSVVAIYGPLRNVDGGGAFRAYWTDLLNGARDLANTDALFVGDFNTASSKQDSETGSSLPGATQLGQLLQMGWRDAFRALHGDRIEYTYWNRYGGFRIDHCLLSPGMRNPTRMMHVTRIGGFLLVDPSRASKCLSDHAALLIEIGP